MNAQTGQVRTRRVFHIPGYDPFPPRRYRELYRSEGAAQAKISGYDIAIKAQTSDASFRWTVGARIEGQPVTSQVDVLVWSDIVRDSMAHAIPATYLQLVQTAWTYISTGTLRRLMWMRKGPVIAALYPVVMLLTQLVLAVGIGSWLGGVVETGGQGALAWAGSTEGVVFTGLAWGLWALSWVVMGVVAVAILRWFRARDSKLFAYYLMHDYAYSAQLQGQTPPALAVRMREFQTLIAAALQEDVDEVLVVGHSSGAHLAVSILAEMLRAGQVPGNGPALAFLSLGQVVPMVSFLPQAHELRRDLADLSASDALTWVDVSAPGDGCCFALCDPVAVSGVAPDNKRWPLVISAAFTQSLTPARWKALRWRFFRLHFQYLCAFDRPKDYDYFQITAGPLTLAARYAGRKPSASRIDSPVSRYTSKVR
ncbi:hypothetical protein AN191_04955 [Loktanella sp. 5RATIMAR09]|uniref:hypothetical protein n=1 Tax=Loktanella sp. 5RATIMAR09 TaxID=1225655 RepID=UPI0006EBDE93|nr:hypothetical protein [Loktanella sp. 5RATIMAR09]KQI73234.1 hypothetical protein AN191_04955 [Loktanella sp. 5RATIMAR09]